MSLGKLTSRDERGVSPVIGVILMVAITVILAAVIASFVLGLGGNNEPAPSPTISSSEDAGQLQFDVTGGDDFPASDAEMDFSVTVNDTRNSNGPVTIDNSFALTDSNPTYTDSNLDDNLAVTINIPGDDVTAGDSITFEQNGGGSDFDFQEWEVEIIYNPPDQDSTIIYSDSS